jgi:hypothetical protein
VARKFQAINVRFLGGAGEVGRSAILIDDTLLLDFGMKTADPPQFPVETPDPDALQRATSHARFVTGRDGQRKRIADQNTAIVTTSGLLGGEEILVVQFAKIVGPALIYSAVAAETDRQIIQKVIILWSPRSTLLTRSESNEHSFVDSLHRENVL